MAISDWPCSMITGTYAFFALNRIMQGTTRDPQRTIAVIMTECMSNCLCQEKQKPSEEFVLKKAQLKYMALSTRRLAEGMINLHYQDICQIGNHSLGVICDGGVSTFGCLSCCRLRHAKGNKAHIKGNQN